MLYIAAWSGGKDSTYMINELLKRKLPLNEVIFCDTGYEFPIMYEYIKRMKQYWETKYPHVKITLLNWGNNGSLWARYAETPFTKGEHKGKIRGFPHHLGMSWCTRELKIQALRKYINKTYKIKHKDFSSSVVEYVGIAYNEPSRVRDNHEVYPLVEWKITEDTIVQELLEQGLHNPLYNHFHRTGCFTCPKQSLNSLYKIYANYKEEWSTIVAMADTYKDAGINLFKGYTIKQLEDKFMEYKERGIDTLLMEEQPIGCMCK